MRLTREISRRDPKSGKTYYKWRVTLPEQKVETLGWGASDELDARIIAGALVLKRRPKERPQTA